MHISSLWKSVEIYTSYFPDTDGSREDNSVKNWRSLTISNPESNLHNINAHTKFGEKPLAFTQVIVPKRKHGCVAGR